MWIVTTGETHWPFNGETCSAYDTETGIQYKLMVDKDSTSKHSNPVILHIKSAHSSQPEQGEVGITMFGDEALNFFKSLSNIDSLRLSDAQTKLMNELIGKGLIFVLGL